MENKNEIITVEQYEMKLQELKKREFLADMCDDFSVWNRERNAIALEYQELFRIAKVSGLIE